MDNSEDDLSKEEIIRQFDKLFGREMTEAERHAFFWNRQRKRKRVSARDEKNHPSKAVAVSTLPGLRRFCRPTLRTRHRPSPQQSA